LHRRLLVRIGPVEGGHVTDAVDEVAAGARGDLRHQGVAQFPIAGVDLDLDEFMVGQSALDLGDDAVG
jgi:hypothetical protein